MEAVRDKRHCKRHWNPHSETRRCERPPAPNLEPPFRLTSQQVIITPWEKKDERGGGATVPSKLGLCIFQMRLAVIKMSFSINFLQPFHPLTSQTLADF